MLVNFVSMVGMRMSFIYGKKSNNLINLHQIFYCNYLSIHYRTYFKLYHMINVIQANNINSIIYFWWNSFIHYLIIYASFWFMVFIYLIFYFMFYHWNRIKLLELNLNQYQFLIYLYFMFVHFSLVKVLLLLVLLH